MWGGERPVQCLGNDARLETLSPDEDVEEAASARAG